MKLLHTLVTRQLAERDYILHVAILQHSNLTFLRLNCNCYSIGGGGVETNTQMYIDYIHVQTRKRTGIFSLE